MLWGIDLGGTKIEGAVLPAIGSIEPVCRLRIPTEAELGYEHILSKIQELLKLLTKECGVEPQALGVGHPGTEDPRTSTLKNSNTQCLNGRALRQDLQQLLGIPIHLANDANCFALAESLFGAASGYETVFGVILGTGVGGGIVVNGTVLSGSQGVAGEWGHNVLLENGNPCYCGKIGCVETVISGPALEAFYEQRSKTYLRLDQILKRNATDESAAATLNRLVTQFGRAIATVINIVDPHCVVIGGGVSNIEALYSQGKIEAAKYVFNNRLETVICKNALGDSAGVFGAALLTR